MTFPTSYESVKSHLELVQRDPSTLLNQPLIDKLKAEITDKTDRVVPATLLTQISQLLPVIQEDPTPLTSLAIKATAYFTFTDLRSVDPPVNLVAGFQTSSPPVNLLALSLLRKAGWVASDAAIVAGDSELVASLVELWLSTPSTGVAQSALDAIRALMEVDLASPLERNESGHKKDEMVGQGLMWRRMFTDKGVYGRLFSLCSLKDDGPGSMQKRDKTIAQGRLMSLIKKTGKLRWDIISRSQIPEIEKQYGTESLLHFAACVMVDQSDVLMHMNLLKFLRGLLKIDAPGLVARTYVQSASTFSSPALDFLISHNLHSAILGQYLNETQLDPVDAAYVIGPVTGYVSRYAELYPNHFLQNPQSLLDRILSRIVGSFSIPSHQWAHGSAPTAQLGLLSSLPRVMLVEATKRHLNPILALPTTPPNNDVFDSLAKILRGPSNSKMTNSMQLSSSGQTPTDWGKEAAAARILYFIYLNEHGDFWTDIVGAADILIMQEVALSAIVFMRTVIKANWQLSAGATSSDRTSRFNLPSEEELGRLSPATHGFLPSTGLWAVLTPPALGTVLPWLFKPPRKHGEFAAGGAADSRQTVFKVATAKFGALNALYTRLSESDDRSVEMDDIMRTVKQLVDAGPFGLLAPPGREVEAAGL